MLVSVASFAPIIVVAPVSDFVGTTNVLIVLAAAITISGLLSFFTRGPLKPAEARAHATGLETPAGFDPVAIATASELEAEEGRRASHAHEEPSDADADGDHAELDAGVPVVDAPADR
jgi:hypothetical protein